MKTFWMSGALAAAGIMLAVGTASAEDTLKLAVGQRGNWDTSVSEIGQRAGIFKKHGLVLEIVYTQGAGETQQAVISGSVDIGVAAGVMGVLGAFSKGAPVRIIGAETTGAGDLYWYVKADSPIKTVKDFSGKTVAYSTNGSSTHGVVTALVKENGITPKLTATGGPPGTLTQVMSGQIDVGYSAPPFALQEIEDGKLRIIASGNDAPSLRDQTVRVDIASLQFIEKRREVLDRFRTAYKEALDWMYADPKAIALWSASINVSPKLGQIASDRFQTKESRTYDRFTGLDKIMADAIQAKLLTRKLTPEELDRLIMKPPM